VRIAAIAAYLAGHDTPSAAELSALGATGKDLMAITTDEETEGLTRARAVAAMRLLPSPAVEGFLSKLIADHGRAPDATMRLILRRAAVALGWIGGGDAADRIAALFDNDDPEVRVDAVLGISMSRAENAAALLRRQLVGEPSPRVREQIQRQLAALPRAAQEPPGAKKTPPTGEPMRAEF
jgi:HEAT repeat protein